MIYPTAKITPETRLELGGGAWIGDFVFVNLSSLIMGKGAQINAFSSLTGGGEVGIGEYSTLSYGVRIISGTDTTKARYMNDQSPLEDREVIVGSVKIGSGCFIGANSVICISKRAPNLEIGDNVVIGALSYVDGNIAKNIIGWGRPFRPERERQMP